MIGKFVIELHSLTNYVNTTFDGDCLNLMYLINKQFIEEAEKKFNPRNSAFISRNDGRFNNDVNHCRDTLVNANCMLNLSRDKYGEERIARIRALKEKYSR